MNAFTPIARNETDRARILIETACQDIERMERDLRFSVMDDRQSAALDSAILEQQAILMKEAAFLLGVPVERFCRAAGL